YNELKHPSDNESYPTCHINIYFKCGIHNRKFRKSIHGTSEHHELDQDKQDLFNGSDPHCSGHLQIHSDLNFFLLVNTIFTLTPFTVSLTLFLLLIFSLWRPVKNMQHNANGSRCVSTTAHIKTLKTVVTFLLLYMIFFLSLLSLCRNADFNHRNNGNYFPLSPFMCPDPSEQEAESILAFCDVLD
ncbi:hypothetical protein U0070_023476, partial [Myodes glareolus]